jgi:hypothetical protein
VIFAIVTLASLLPGRKLGWFMSRKFLYTLPKPISYMLCIMWGIIVAYLIHYLILWQNPNIVIRIIFGYFLGGYISMPNYGLLDESTIPDEELSRHIAIKLIPLLSYIVFVVILSFI